MQKLQVKRKNSCSLNIYGTQKMSLSLLDYKSQWIWIWVFCTYVCGGNDHLQLKQFWQPSKYIRSDICQSVVPQVSDQNCSQLRLRNEISYLLSSCLIVCISKQLVIGFKNTAIVYGFQSHFDLNIASLLLVTIPPYSSSAM